jgi:precorrin-4/cobalt-precorrin-4 C11-methyltransferase
MPGSELTDKNNMVYFIGSGPGDPGYLTRDGEEALRECRAVYAVEPYPDTFASLLRGKEVRDPFRRLFHEITTDIEETLVEGSVGVLIPGDLTVFSPFLPLVEHFGERSRVIAGVGTMNAAAALLKRTLVMPGISHSVILTSPKRMEKEGKGEEIGQLARAAGTMVLFMNNLPLENLSAHLAKGFSPETPVAIVSRAGLTGERIFRSTVSSMGRDVDGDDIFGLESGDPSLALILVGDVLEASSDPGSWDRRKERFWDKKKGKV